MSEPNAFVVPQAVIELAVPVIAAHAAEWPEDDWFGLGPDWDLNLFRLEAGAPPRATIYAVIDGQTQTDRGYPLAPLNMMFSRGLPMPH